MITEGFSWEDYWLRRVPGRGAGLRPGLKEEMKEISGRAVIYRIGIRRKRGTEFYFIFIFNQKEIGKAIELQGFSGSGSLISGCSVLLADALSPPS